MLRVLVIVLPIALTVFALVDCVQTDEDRVRAIPKIAWIVAIVILPFAGPIAWLLAGKDRSGSADARTAGGPSRRQPPPRPIAPDDDPDFLRQLNAGNAEHERMLERWEEELRRREQEMRGDTDDEGNPAGKG